MSRFRIWFCRTVLGRTPMLWQPFGADGRLLRRGYWKLDAQGKRTVFIAQDGGIFV